MRRGTPFEISKEVFDRAMENNGYITSEDKANLFDVCDLCGYGVYGAMAYIDDETGKMMCMYSTGDSCD